MTRSRTRSRLTGGSLRWFWTGCVCFSSPPSPWWPHWVSWPWLPTSLFINTLPASLTSHYQPGPGKLSICWGGSLEVTTISPWQTHIISFLVFSKAPDLTEMTALYSVMNSWHLTRSLSQWWLILVLGSCGCWLDTLLETFKGRWWKLLVSDLMRWENL